MMKALIFVIHLLMWAALMPAALAQESEMPPGIELQGAATYAFSVGDVRITALSDGTVPQDLHVLLRGTSDARTDALLKESFLRNPVEASINAFLFRLGDRVVLVDTGSGDFFGPGYGGKLLQSLAAVHTRPEEVSDVLLTHAHDDHMGGLVHDGKLVFPNAIVHVSRANRAPTPTDTFADPHKNGDKR